MKIKKLTVNNKNKDKQFLIGTENYIKNASPYNFFWSNNKQ